MCDGVCSYGIHVDQDVVNSCEWRSICLRVYQV